MQSLCCCGGVFLAAIASDYLVAAASRVACFSELCLVILMPPSFRPQVGVKQGGCSGMSYVMDFEQPDNIKEDDYVIDYESGAFKLACDPKSLL